MINSKITKVANQQTEADKLFKLLESIDWKLWEMMNLMKASTEEKVKPLTKSKARKSVED